MKITWLIMNVNLVMEDSWKVPRVKSAVESTCVKTRHVSWSNRNTKVAMSVLLLFGLVHSSAHTCVTITITMYYIT